MGTVHFMDYDSPAMGYLILLLARYRQRMDTLQSFPSHPQGHKHQAQEHYPTIRNVHWVLIIPAVNPANKGIRNVVQRFELVQTYYKALNVFRYFGTGTENIAGWVTPIARPIVIFRKARTKYDSVSDIDDTAIRANTINTPRIFSELHHLANTACRNAEHADDIAFTPISTPICDALNSSSARIPVKSWSAVKPRPAEQTSRR